MKSDAGQPLQVVMLPWLEPDHILPFIHLSNSLDANGVKVTFLCPPCLVSNIRTNLHANIPIANYTLPPDVADFPAGGTEMTKMNSAAGLRLIEAVDASRQQIEAALLLLSPQVVVFDFIYHWLPASADSFGIKSVYFSVGTASSAASSMFLARYLPSTNLGLAMLRRVPSGFLAAISGLKGYEVHNAMNYLKRDRNARLSIYERVLTTMDRSSAIALNSSSEIEGTYINFFLAQCRKPVLLAGSLMGKPTADELETRWEKWLSRHPKGSVVFCSFGNEACLSEDQITELIAGFEMTGLSFLAILNFPPGTGKTREAIVGERAGGRGLVHDGEVQQQQQRLMLRHSSVGVHVGHGESGLMMEAVASGCQVVLLPVKGDQFFNARLMADGLNAGVAVKRRSKDGRFSKEAVSEAVRIVVSDGTLAARKVRANNAKVRQLLLNQSIQDCYIRRFVADLQELVASPRGDDDENGYLPSTHEVL
ncbi:Anthocyanidin 3-O-glucosyltransferase [Nymphaea thermarum]|nr:Anthocyanidin 3-O-glucosyltransferase [Nymphaea thermarum]